jgi:hypothetical protein
MLQYDIYLVTFTVYLRNSSNTNNNNNKKKFPAFMELESSSPYPQVSTWVILNIRFLRRGVVSTSPKPQFGGPPLVDCPRLLIQFIHSYPPYRRPFLHPQPEDAPCRGDRNPHLVASLTKCHQFLNKRAKLCRGLILG